MPPGDYTFAVAAGNEWGIWSEPTRIELSIAPPFWRTWWFALAVILAVGGGVAVVVTLRVRQLLALERLRTHIAADLHDDIGAGLTEISILSSLAARRESGPEPDSLERIGQTARRLTQSMSDIVWLVNPRTDTVPDLTRRVIDTYRPLLEGSGIELETRGLDSLGRTKLDMASRQHLLLILKELFNNVLKHSHASRVSLEVGRRGGGMCLLLEDDGDGFDTGAERTGNGLANIHRRAGELGAKLAVTSRPGTGTRAELSWR